MGVVARLQVTSVEDFINTRIVKMQPVLADNDEHVEEIRSFFEATPGGKVELNFPLDDNTFKSGDQTYLYFENEKHEGSYPELFKVTSIKVHWASEVEFQVAHRSPTNGYNSSKMAFTIRNQVAAEQFQYETEVYIRLVKIEQDA